MTVALDGESLTAAQVVAVARAGARVELAPAARARMAECRQIVHEALAAAAEPIYGFTTGVGVRRRVAVSASEQAEYGRRMIADHRIAAGDLAPAEVVRATMLRLANGLAKGTPGVRPELADLVIDALNSGLVPPVRMLGSAGQSDLAPMADLAAGLAGEFAVETGEVHALISNSAFSTALATLALADAERLLAAATACGALDFEAFAANPSMLAEALGRERPFPGLVRAQADLRAALDGSFLWTPEPRNHHDPLSFRNLPTILGAAHDGLGFAAQQVAIELNASQENPMVDRASRRIVSTANYEMIALSQALDLARIVLAPVITSAHERLVKLLQAPQSGLSDGLEAPGSSYGTALSELAWSAQALATEARLLSQPVSAEVGSSSLAEGTEDRMSMAPLSARRTAEMVALGDELLAIGAVVSCQAIELRGSRPLGRGTAASFGRVRERVAFVGAGDSIAADRSPVLELVRSGAL